LKINKNLIKGLRIKINNKKIKIEVEISKAKRSNLYFLR
jgi:hypothetical protein